MHFALKSGLHAYISNCLRYVFSWSVVGSYNGGFSWKHEKKDSAKGQHFRKQQKLNLGWWSWFWAKIWQNWLCRPSLWGCQEEECQSRGLHGLSQGMGADPGLDCSHLCHNTLCCNPDHLVLELRSINNNRNHCKNGMHCFGHGSHTKCLIWGEFIISMYVCLPFLPVLSPKGSKFFSVLWEANSFSSVGSRLF